MSIQRFSLVKVQRTEIECLGCDDSGSWVHYDDHLDDRAEAVAAARREALEEAARTPSPAVRALVRACYNIFDRDGNPPLPNTHKAVTLYTDIAAALAAVEKEINND